MDLQKVGCKSNEEAYSFVRLERYKSNIEVDSEK
jgi:hypothetical protein